MVTLDSEAGEGLSEFAGDRAASDNGQPARQGVEFPDRVGRDGGPRVRDPGCRC